MFTDNSTTEGAFWKGTSTSPKLLELVLRLRKLEMKSGLILHLIHVSGRRMIDCGVDGLSRGDHTTGIMQGNDIRTYVPLHLNAFTRSPALVLQSPLSRSISSFVSFLVSLFQWLRLTNQPASMMYDSTRFNHTKRNHTKQQSTSQTPVRHPSCLVVLPLLSPSFK